MSGARPVIGLVGQVCAGKSAVAEAFRKRGARVWEADRWVRVLYARKDVKAQVRALCGAGVFGPDGEVDRRALGARAFADATVLTALTRDVIYPRVGRQMRRELAAFRRERGAQATPALVLEAPTLLEAGLERHCDRLLFVAAPREFRRRWAAEQRGWPEEEVARRERYLLDDTAKRQRCDVVLENTGTLADLDAKVAELWKTWVAPASCRQVAPASRRLTSKERKPAAP